MATEPLKPMAGYWGRLKADLLRQTPTPTIPDGESQWDYRESPSQLWTRHGIQSGLPPPDFSTFRPAMQPSPEGKQQAADALAAFVLWSSGGGRPWLLCIGLTGCGKSHLMKAALHSMVVAQDKGFYMTAAQFNRRMKDFQSDPGLTTPDEYVYKLGEMKAPLLIDDIGAGYYDKSGYLMTRFEELLDMRYEASLPTAVTSNLEPAQFKQHIGQRIFSRLLYRVMTEQVLMDKCVDIRQEERP